MDATCLEFRKLRETPVNLTLLESTHSLAANFLYNSTLANIAGVVVATRQ